MKALIEEHKKCILPRKQFIYLWWQYLKLKKSDRKVRSIEKKSPDDNNNLKKKYKFMLAEVKDKEKEKEIDIRKKKDNKCRLVWKSKFKDMIEKTHKLHNIWIVNLAYQHCRRKESIVIWLRARTFNPLSVSYFTTHRFCKAAHKSLRLKTILKRDKA